MALTGIPTDSPQAVKKHRNKKTKGLWSTIKGAWSFHKKAKEKQADIFRQERIKRKALQ